MVAVRTKASGTITNSALEEKHTVHKDHVLHLIHIIFKPLMIIFGLFNWTVQFSTKWR